jgi:mRNA-degrading endonuclease HigB of HigAB toxin-antitoxin module
MNSYLQFKTDSKRDHQQVFEIKEKILQIIVATKFRNAYSLIRQIYTPESFIESDRRKLGSAVINLGSI